MKILYYTGRSLTRIIFGLFLRAKVRGQENLPPEGGFILASNHLSYWDPPLVGSWVPRQVYFMAKQELFKNPLFGGIIKRTNALPLRRGTIDRVALDLCVETLKAGNVLTVFPEGTRAKEGHFLTPKPGVGMVAVRAKCPIVPALIQGSNRLKACLLGTSRLSITYGRPLEADWVESFDATKESYTQIAEAVMERIGSLRNEAHTVNNAAGSSDY
ncbi:MAG: 1-acyl-sn-glycerol-3-phosphate acyltransferase [candidate division Zixibacteria bacterium]|nr:1-acyl-sn-glycerol-3-phosphate acyltransferase [candidate division Zixibacteria bacterium]MDH3937813.1 1-acyl-sn-glycerol-3-phosphate acyltransferase [candidate division Zixibacteria bacterium]MDH4033114.1 1-acyl-sn-glycerol-3-phosphate acyltransferase [candidate division Zixibacteria bacterium]